jgi:hypothetical protein
MATSVFNRRYIEAVYSTKKGNLFRAGKGSRQLVRRRQRPLPQKRKDARDLLASVVNWFTEGFKMKTLIIMTAFEQFVVSEICMMVEQILGNKLA